MTALPGGPVPDALRVLIVDDHRVLREGLARSLEAAGFHVCAEASSGAEALVMAATTSPDAVLMDISLPDMDGIAVVRRIHERQPELPMIMLSMLADRSTMQDARAAGAVAYLTKDTSTMRIAEVLLGVTGTAVAGPPSGLSSRPDAGPSTLSRRELEVLQLIAEGKSTVAAANELFISVKTVKNHLANIYEKLDVRDRTQAVVEAVRLGLVRLR